MIKKALFGKLNTKVKSLIRKGNQWDISFPQQKLIPEYGRHYLQVNQEEKEANGFIFILPRESSINKAYSYDHP